VVLIGLNEVKVSAFTLREAVLTVKLELSSDNGVLSPAVKTHRSLRENESTSIRDTRVKVRRGSVGTRSKVGSIKGDSGLTTSSRVNTPPFKGGDINSTSIMEETRTINK
jgi:hypothetical protein